MRTHECWNSRGGCLALVALLALGPLPAAAEEGWKTYWRNGTRVESEDGSFKLKLGGRIQADWGFLSEDDRLRRELGTLEDGSEFRRARLFVEGVVFHSVEFKAQYDFADGDSSFKDVYLGLKDLPGVGGVRVGHMKEPFGLQELASSKYVAFVERSTPSSAFAPSRNMGLMLHNRVSDERVSWAVGLFQDSDDFGDSLSNRGTSDRPPGSMYHPSAPSCFSPARMS